MEKQLDLYSNYLISSIGQTSATDLSRLLDGQISHRIITRFLTTSVYNNKPLFKSVKLLVREQENENGCLIFDDCILKRHYMYGELHYCQF